MKRSGSVFLGSMAALLLLAVAFAAPSGAEGADATGIDGKAIFLAQKCDMCHSVPAAGIEAKVKSEKMKGPDVTGDNSRDPQQLAKFLRKQSQLDGKDHKKEFKGSDEELTALIAWLGEQKQE